MNEILAMALSTAIMFGAFLILVAALTMSGVIVRRGYGRAEELAFWGPVGLLASIVVGVCWAFLHGLVT